MACQVEEGFLKILFEDTSNDSAYKRILPFENSKLYYAKITDAIKLTKDEDVKDVYDITLGTEDISYNFEPGDTIGVLPNNNFVEVKEIFEYLNCTGVIDKSCKIILTNEKKKRIASHLPVNTTLKSIFMKHVDIRSPPKKAFLKILATYAENKEEKSILENLSTPSNSEKYISFISSNGRSLVSLLHTFPSCKIPIERIIENLPPLQPRPYTISSSPFLKDEIHITFSVEYFDNKTKGVCTGWLENIITPIISDSAISQSEENVCFYFRKPNSFRLHSEITDPIIMIGPGTGVAPFIGFLQHLSLQNKILDTWLFYGCRYKYRDYLYKNIIQKHQQNRYLTKLSTAFSREQNEKIYVQDLIEKEAAEIYQKLVNENASVYVCGGIKNLMQNVQKSIKSCLINNGMTVDQTDLFIASMIKTNKYVEDKWI